MEIYDIIYYNSAVLSLYLRARNEKPNCRNSSRPWQKQNRRHVEWYESKSFYEKTHFRQITWAHTIKKCGFLQFSGRYVV